MRKLFLLAGATVMMFTACNTGNESGNGTAVNAPAQTSGETKEERNKQVIRESITGMNNHNVDEVLKNVAPNSIDYGDGSGPAIKNVDSIKSGMKMWLNAMPDYKGENLEYIADGNKVVVYGDWSGTFKNDMMGMKATGKKFSIKDVDIFTLDEDGKITEHRSVLPFATVMKQVGAVQK